jgi:hypothetical protein
VPEASGPFRSSASSFRYFASGLVAYVAGAALLFSGLGGSLWQGLEVVLLGAGTVLVLIGFVVDARSKRSPPPDAE